MCNNEKVTVFELNTEATLVSGFWERIWRALWHKIWDAIFDVLKEIWDKWRNSPDTGSCYQFQGQNILVIIYVKKKLCAVRQFSPYKCKEEEKANNLGNCGIPDQTTGVATGCKNCFLQVQNYMNDYYEIERGCGEL